MSAEDDPEVCADLLGRMAAGGWASRFSLREAITAAAGSSPHPPNRSALTAQVQQDGGGSITAGIRDLRRPRAISLVCQGERDIWGAVRGCVGLVAIHGAGQVSLWG